jgi:hypothetical protein
MNNNLKKNIDYLFNILTKDAATIVKHFASIRSLLANIFEDDYFGQEGDANELLQKLLDLVNDDIKKHDELLKVAINIIFYDKLFKYVTGIKFSTVGYCVDTIFAAICYQLQLSRKENEKLLQNAEANADALMRKINVIVAIDTLRVICQEHLNKLATLKTKDKNSRIEMLNDMIQTLWPSPDEDISERPIQPIASLQNRLNTFKKQFTQYRNKFLDRIENPQIHAADKNFIAKIKRVFSRLYLGVVGIFRKERNIYKNFTSKVEKHIVLNV